MLLFEAVLLFARGAGCNYHVKAQRLPGVHVSPDRSAENVAFARKKDTVSQCESKYRLGSSKCQEVALPNLSFSSLDKRQKVELIRIFPLWELVVHLFIQKAPEMINLLWITFR